jgi:molecular chaperone GrpE
MDKNDQMTDETTPEKEPYEFDDAAADDELEAARAEAAQLREQMLRIAAEAENTKRRAERDANDARAYAIQKFARDLLGVADNLSRALQHAPREDADPAVKNLVVGLDMTEKELLAAFERNGLKKVDPARGAKFDPNFHQAMMEQHAPDLPAGSVIQVMQSGYELMGRIVRPAMVVVADRKSGAQAVQAEDPPPANAYAAPEDDAGATVDTKA